MNFMFSRISSSRDGRAAVKYAEGKAHNKKTERNILIEPINLLPNGKYTEQMEKLWKKARKNHTTQVRRIVVSFSKKELNPDSAKDLEVAVNIIKEFIASSYPNRQAVLYFQKDGHGGCLHCHAIVNDCDLSESHKACSRIQGHYKYVRNNIDKVASKYITLDDGKNNKSRLTQTERVKKEKAATIIEQNTDKSDTELQQMLISEKAYSYKEDMRSRITKCIDASANEEEFFSLLKDKGISVIKKNSPKYGEHYVYDFVDCPVGVKNTKSRSYKLGYSYGPEAIHTVWNEKLKCQDSNNKTEADDFTKWLHENHYSYFIFDDNGRLVATDFEKMNVLHEEFEKQKTNMTIANAEMYEEEPTAESKENIQVQAIQHFASNTLPLVNKLNNQYTRNRMTNRRVAKAYEHFNIDAQVINKQKVL